MHTAWWHGGPAAAAVARGHSGVGRHLTIADSLHLLQLQLQYAQAGLNTDAHLMAATACELAKDPLWADVFCRATTEGSSLNSGLTDIRADSACGANNTTSKPPEYSALKKTAPQTKAARCSFCHRTGHSLDQCRAKRSWLHAQRYELAAAAGVTLDPPAVPSSKGNRRKVPSSNRI